jgi:hypothetical protein
MTTMRLSKPGTELQPVSYLHTIDDEDVLKALEKLKRRAIGVTANSHSAANPPVNTPSISKAGSRTPVAPISSFTASSTPPARTPSRDGDSRIVSTTAASPKVPKPASPPSLRKTVVTSAATDEFVPLWKLDPVLEPPSIPRWQTETAVQERADEGVIRDSPRTSVQERPTQEQTVTPEREDVRVKDSTRTASREILRLELNAIKYEYDPNRRQEHWDFAHKVTNELPSPPHIRMPSKFEIPSKKQNLSLSIENFSTILNKFGCFGMVDGICQPTTDFDEDYFTLFSDDSLTEAESYISKSDIHDKTEIKEVDSSTTASSQSRNEETTRKGLGELGPMVATLESFKSFLALGESKKSHLRYISRLLYRMEDKLQEYRGYRRRTDPDPRENDANLETVSQQVDEVNKLILRVIEDFIDEQLMKVTKVGNSSLLSTFMDDMDGMDESLTLGELDNDMTTIGDDTITLFDEPPNENDYVVVPPADSFDRDYRPQSVGDSSRLPKKSTLIPRKDATCSDDSGSPSSPGLASDKALFLSSETCTDDQNTIRRLNADDSNDHKSNRDDKSQRSSKSNTSRTTMMKNLSKVISRSPKTSRNTQHASPSTNRKSSQGITDLDGMLFVPAQHESKQGLPPLQPKPRWDTRDSILVETTDIDTCSEAKPSTPTRILSTGRSMPTRHDSASSDANGSLRGLNSGTKGATQSPKSVTCEINPMDDHSV